MSSSPLSAHIAGIGVIGPGLDDWAAARAVLAGETPWHEAPIAIPAPALLPPAERRRVGAVVKLALSVGLQAVEAAGADAARLATVFASSGGDGHNCHAICETLAGSDRLISPTRFHNSVNNAASGYWGIATGAMAASTIVSSFDGSAAGGLLEALAQVRSSARPVLLVIYDHPYPAPLHAARPMASAFGVALLLAADGDGPRLRLEGLAAEPATTLADLGGALPALDALRTGVPAARLLPLLALIARGAAGRVVLDYLDDIGLALAVGSGGTAA